MQKLLGLIQYLLYLFIFLLPWQTRWMYYEGFTEAQTWSLYGTEILIWLIIVLVAIYTIKLKKSQIPNSKIQINFKSQILKFKTVSIIVVFLIWTVLSLIWAVNFDQAIYWFVKILSGILLLMILRIIPFDKIKLMWAVVAGAVLQSPLAIYQVAAQSVFSNKWLGMAGKAACDLGVSVVEFGGERLLRAYGSFPHPNILAGYLVVSLLMTLMLYLHYVKSNKLKIACLACSVLILIGLFLTFSRGAWIGFVIGLILFWIFNYRENFKSLFNFTIITLLTIVILINIFYQPFITRLNGEERLEIKSTQERVSLYDQGFEIIKENWLLGVGIGNYSLVLQEKYPSLESWDYQPVHNLYLMVLAELGIIGLLLLVGVLYSCYKIPNPQIQISPPEADLFEAENNIQITNSKLILIILLVIGLFDHYLWTLWPGIMLFWLVAGVALTPGKLNNKIITDKH